MFVILLALWLVFAGSVTLTNLLLGALVAGLITLCCTKFMGYSTKRFYRGFSKADEIAVYLAYLLKEIVRENFDVLRFIYRKGQPKPTLVRFNGGVQHEPLRVLVFHQASSTFRAILKKALYSISTWKYSSRACTAYSSPSSFTV